MTYRYTVHSLRRKKVCCVLPQFDRFYLNFAGKKNYRNKFLSKFSFWDFPFLSFLWADDYFYPPKNKFLLLIFFFFFFFSIYFFSFLYFFDFIDLKQKKIILLAKSLACEPMNFTNFQFFHTLSLKLFNFFSHFIPESDFFLCFFRYHRDSSKLINWNLIFKLTTPQYLIINFSIS